MYRPIPSKSERTTTAAAVVLIHAALAYAFLNLSGAMNERDAQDDMQLINVYAVPPPPPIVEEVVELQRAEDEEGEASPPNIESEATPVVAPEPRIALPVPPPMPVSPTPNEGNEPTQGAAPVPGPGTGTGGIGTGLGAGGSGSGRGGGGTGGEATRPALVSGKFTTRDYPRELQRRWNRLQAVLVIFKVQLNGRATDCRVYASSGDPDVDRETCRLVEQRLILRPARNDRGEPSVAEYAYQQARTR